MPIAPPTTVNVRYMVTTSMGAHQRSVC